MPDIPSLRRQMTWREAKHRQRLLREGTKEAFLGMWEDTISPNLLPIKATFFLIMGATQCIAPFMTIFMISLGLRLEETAIILAVSPLIPIVSPFLAGIITDKIGNFKIFLVISVAASGILALVNIGIPPARTEHEEIADTLKLNVMCSPDSRGLIMSFKTDHCIDINSTMYIDKFTVSNCGYQCSTELIGMSKRLRNKLKKKLLVKTAFNDTFSIMCEIEKGRRTKCFLSDKNESNSANINEKIELSSVQLKTFKRSTSTTSSVTKLRVEDFRPPETTKHDKFYCIEEPITLPTITISIDNTKYDTSPPFTKSPNCLFHCDGQLPKRKICNDVNEEIINNVTLSVWLFIISKMIGFFMVGLTYSMFEAAVVAVLKQSNRDYGLQRIYGSLGGMIFAPFTGFLIDTFGKGHYSDYYIAFGLYCGLKLLCAVVLTKLDLEFKTPSASILGNIWSIFSNLETVLLIGAVFCSGMCYGFIEHFLPWHLKELGASNKLIGFTITVASVSAIPCLAVAGFVCKKFGHVQTISFGLVCYAIRCIGYSVLKKVIWCLPLEALEGITTGLLIAAAIMYGAELSDRDNIGTLQGVLATSHYGLGKSVGSLIGGHLMGQISAVAAFRIFSAFAFTVAFSYYLVFRLILQPRRQKLEKYKEEIAQMPIKIFPIKHNFAESSFYTSTPKKELQKTYLDKENEDEIFMGDSPDNSQFNEEYEENFTQISQLEN